ncbi:DnaJ C-terminal domain-containing protein [Dinoroseobacter sp. PD6]|uniref:DnaJ C-terminal domain-containing protein n=1 Tax=Dinoroseobacter sp. PD6 TaxID=3028384 RepID=UPI00237C2CA5|nr:DnaJ C-terminal domain-containing protein [Dinoroseobacter sp. PD6]MDD9717374.1 DnaJ C-terminal domain-containing protein [Dinoroseobacter sp. PD6]
MSEDPYKVLGVAKDATQAEIKKAYRKLAKALHPDLHPGDKTKEAQFQAVAAANDLLGDPEKRKRFDAGEIDASGQERPQRQYYRDHAGADPQGRYASGAGYGDFEDLSGVFSDLFGRRGQARGGAQGFAARGADVRYRLDVDFMDAAMGAKRPVPLPDGSAIDLTIPAGVRDGQTLRLRGKGQPGFGGGPAGDAYVEIEVRPHKVFARDENDIEVEVPITFDEAVLGAKVEVPTLSGKVSMGIPRGATSGQRLRLKGRGIKPAKGEAGDQYVRLKIVTPPKIDAEMEDIARRWRDLGAPDPRASLWREL